VKTACKAHADFSVFKIGFPKTDLAGSEFVGHAGRPPKPAEIKILEGRAGANKVVDEPRPRPVAPPIPSWLSTAARRIWRAHARELERAGLLTSVDGPLFATYCEAVAEARQLQELLEKSGRTYTTPSGFVRPRPEVGLLRESRRLMLSCASELGLSPASRKRMAVLIDRRGDHSLDDLLD